MELDKTIKKIEKTLSLKEPCPWTKKPDWCISVGCKNCTKTLIRELKEAIDRKLALEYEVGKQYGKKEREMNQADGLSKNMIGGFYDRNGVFTTCGEIVGIVTLAEKTILGKVESITYSGSSDPMIEISSKPSPIKASMLDKYYLTDFEKQAFEKIENAGGVPDTEKVKELAKSLSCQTKREYKLTLPDVSCCDQCPMFYDQVCVLEDFLNESVVHNDSEYTNVVQGYRPEWCKLEDMK